MATSICWKNIELRSKWTSKSLNFSCPIEGLNYERAWEAAGKTELGVLLQLKSTISTKHNQTELEHALQYFEKYIYDFPGEFFLQMPFLFTVRIWIGFFFRFSFCSATMQWIRLFCRICWSWLSLKLRVSIIHKPWHAAWNWPKTYHDVLQFDEMQACIHLQMR